MEREHERYWHQCKEAAPGAALWSDETGGEVLEYALVAGLIVIAAIAVIGSVGTKVLARWNSLNSRM
ncbi:MAG: Flp family type IVb pilin [Verrucomicrobiota bacterium]